MKVIDGVHMLWPIYRIGCFGWYSAKLLKIHFRFHDPVWDQCPVGDQTVYEEVMLDR